MTFAHQYNHVHAPVIEPGPPRWVADHGTADRTFTWLQRTKIYFPFFLVCPSASPVQTKQPLINYRVAFQRHPEVQSLGCTRQAKRPTVANYCVSMPHADTPCFWLQANFSNSLLLQFSGMIARWWNNLRFTTSSLSLHMSPFNYHY